MPSYRLISSLTCPFVQRAAFLLEDKGVPYERVNVDLRNKPDWFLALSPLGKVPVLEVDDTVLFESVVINEYLDEVAGERLLPEAALPRARERAWIVFSNMALDAVFSLHSAMDEAAAMEKLETLRERLDRLESNLGTGPLWGGERLSLMDAASLPMLQRLTWTDAYVPQFRLLADRPRVQRWAEVLLARPAVARSAPSDLQERIHRHLTRDRGAPGRRSWLGEVAFQSRG